MGRYSAGIADDITTGGPSLNADTLDGFDGSYYLDYNNLINPTLFDPNLVPFTGTPTTLSLGYGITDAIGVNPKLYTKRNSYFK